MTTTGSVLVFGGSGFIGTHCLRRLSSAGERIISIDLLPPRERLEGVEYRIGDVRDLSELNVSSNIRLIYNFAAIHTTPGHLDHEYYDTNVGGAIEIANFAERHAVPEIIFTSSISVYGASEEAKSENSDLHPTTAYGRSKRLAEEIHCRWQNGDQMRRLVIVRPGVVFGPGEAGNFSRMATLLRNGLFVFPGRKDTIKACIYVDDLLDSLEFARSQNENFILFNASYPQRYTLEQIVKTFRDNHFPSARLVNLPFRFVMVAAKLIGALDILKLGIHQDRVLKLVRSTDIQPGWLTLKGRTFPGGIETALQRWARNTSGQFN